MVKPTEEARKEGRAKAEAVSNARFQLLDDFDLLLQIGPYEPAYEDCEDFNSLNQEFRDNCIKKILESEKALFQRLHDFAHLLDKYEGVPESRLAIIEEWDVADIPIDVKAIGDGKDHRTKDDIKERNKALDELTKHSILEELYKEHPKVRKCALATQKEAKKLSRELDEMKSNKAKIYNKIIALFPVLPECEQLSEGSRASSVLEGGYSSG